jgi:hypothetical protein
MIMHNGQLTREADKGVIFSTRTKKYFLPVMVALSLTCG